MDADRLRVTDDFDIELEGARVFRALLIPRLLILCAVVAALAWRGLVPWRAFAAAAVTAFGLMTAVGLKEFRAWRRLQAELRRLTSSPPRTGTRPTVR